MGQTRGVEIFLRLGQIDADAHTMLWPSGPTSHRMPTIFFTVQQKVVGPLDLAVDAVALVQGVADGQTGKQRQRAGWTRSVLMTAV